MLTPLQHRTLVMIADKDNWRPPSIRAVAKKIDGTPAGTYDAVHALMTKGYLDADYKLTKKGRQAVSNLTPQPNSTGGL